MIALAIVILILGAILLPLPIPLGAPLLAIGFVILISSSPWFAQRVARLRQRHGRLDRGMQWVEERAPTGLATVLRSTRSSL